MPLTSKKCPLESYSFTHEFDVRDYECDLQGIVNNAVYQNYLEHTRHRYIREHGVDFAETTQAGIHLVVVRVEINYKSPLRSGDRFIVGLNPLPISVVRFGFQQDIYRLPDHQTVLQAKVVCAAIGQSGLPMKLPKRVQRLVGNKD